MNEITNRPDERALAEHTRGIRFVESRLLGDILGPLPTLGGASKKRPPRTRADCAADVIEFGYRFAECKRIAGRNWLPWLKEECWDEEYVRPYINVYEWHARCVNDAIGSGPGEVWNFEIDALDIFLLADPSTPEAARAEVVRRAGERLEHADIMAIIRKARAEERKGPKGPVNRPRYRPLPLF